MSDLTPEKARELLVQEQQARVDTARAELEAFLVEWGRRHRVALQVDMLVSQQGNIPQLQIVADA